VYTTTETVYTRVPCNGCALSITAELANFYGGVGPVEIVTGTTTAEEPYRKTLTVCSANPTAPPHFQIPRDGLEDREIRQDEVRSTTDMLEPKKSECTHTRLVQASYIALDEQTRTIYTTTATTTSHIDCGGCNRLYVTTLDFLNPGPVIHFTTTETAETPKTKTEYVCLKTPSIVLGSSLRTLPVQPTASIAALHQRGHPTATSPPTWTHPHPSPSTRSSETTVLVTITRTVYTATVTAVRTSPCGPIDADGPPGAIPRHETSSRGRGGGDGASQTRTHYTTVSVTAEGTWTRPSFHCAETHHTGGFSRPHRRPHPTHAAGGGGVELGGGSEPQQLGQQAVAATVPPVHPPSPLHPTSVTSTFIFPPRR